MVCLQFGLAIRLPKQPNCRSDCLSLVHCDIFRVARGHHRFGLRIELERTSITSKPETPPGIITSVKTRSTRKPSSSMLIASHHQRPARPHSRVRSISSQSDCERVHHLRRREYALRSSALSLTGLFPQPNQIPQVVEDTISLSPCPPHCQLSHLRQIAGQNRESCSIPSRFLRPRDLVVKNGSKARCWTSAFIPFRYPRRKSPHSHQVGVPGAEAVTSLHALS